MGIPFCQKLSGARRKSKIPNKSNRLYHITSAATSNNSAAIHSSMGLQSGVKCTSTVSNVSLNSLLNAMREMKKNDSESNTNRLCVDFDANWLMINKSRANDSVKQRVDKIYNVLKYFSSCGVECAPVCNPEHRHHSKRASVCRKSDRFVKDISIKSARSKHK